MLLFAMPGGFEWLVMTLFCGFPLVAIIGLMYLAYRMVRKRSLDLETRCRKCGYILRGITEPRCPECGERI